MIDEITTNLYRIEVPLPEISLESVNSYVIRGRGRNLIIDTGMQNDECLHVMEEALTELHIDMEKTDFFITHSHGDHIGLAPRLARGGSVIYIDEVEAHVVSMVVSGLLLPEIRDMLFLSGFPDKDPENILPPHVSLEFEPCSTLPFRFIKDGDALEVGEFHFTCVSTPGHSMGHMCLYEPDRRILVAGDHLLKDITPGILGRAGQNPLKQYLSSLDKVHALNVDLVLPGHRLPFGGHRERIGELKKHHGLRNGEALAILREGRRTTYQTASRMTWNVDSDSWDSFPLVQSFFATGETFAHLKYLEEAGEVEKTMEGLTAVYSLP